LVYMNKLKLIAPRGACDTHFHIYEPEYLKWPKAPLAPIPGVTYEDYLKVAEKLGIDSNALKFSPSGDDVVISVAQNIENVRVSIIDKGEGIPTKSRDQIFEIFFRLTPTVPVRRVEQA
jgi:light-regulated signal transduction histidine kinase (bacteriophytochrome)